MYSSNFIKDNPKMTIDGEKNTQKEVELCWFFLKIFLIWLKKQSKQNNRREGRETKQASILS